MQRRKALSRLRPRSQACLIRLFVTNRRQTSGAFLRFWLIWRISRSYMSESAPELVALYGLNRHHTLQLLRRIKLADLEKTAFHPELQKNVTVAEYVDRIGTHGANHLQQIERLKKETSSYQILARRIFCETSISRYNIRNAFRPPLPCVGTSFNSGLVRPKIRHAHGAAGAGMAAHLGRSHHAYFRPDRFRKDAGSISSMH